MNKTIKLPSKGRKLWQIRACVINILLLIISFILTFISVWFYLLSAFVLVSAFVIILFYIPEFYKSYSINIMNDSLKVEFGVLFKQIYIMPYPRLIYIYTVSTPLAKKMGITAAVIKAARGNIFTPELLDTDVNLILKLISGEKNEK